jgi:hypothetical protein
MKLVANEMLIHRVISNARNHTYQIQHRENNIDMP